MRTATLILALIIPALVVPLLAQILRGAAPQAAPSAEMAGAGEGGVWHEVRPGENLRSIARTYYGSARYWRTVQVANDVGLTPDPGARLWVPGRMPELP